MRFENTFRNRWIVGSFVCCCTYFLIFWPMVIVADALLRPLEYPDRLLAAIVVKLMIVLSYFPTAFVIVVYFYRNIWPGTQQ